MGQPSWHDSDDNCAAIRDAGPADTFTSKLISWVVMAALALVLIGVGLASALQRLARKFVKAQAFKRNGRVGLYLIHLNAEQNGRARIHAQSEPVDKR
jgi:hypothetical protein